PIRDYDGSLSPAVTDLILVRRDSMRAIIATDFGGHLLKLIWLTENKTGVSAGICDRIPNPHATYHKDGTYHYKITSKGRVLKIFPEKRAPPKGDCDDGATP